MIRTYTELIQIPTFLERFRYLKLNGHVGEELFGYSRYLNQIFYQSERWKKTRRRIILRDRGCDLGMEDHEIFGTVHVHHMNPLTLQQIKSNDPCLIDPEQLICVSERTHRAITFGDESLLPQELTERKPNDTCPWKQ